MPGSELKQALLTLRDYALSKGLQARLSLHREHSHLVRLANGSVSLNTSEQVTTLSVLAYDGPRSASSQRILDISDQAALCATVDQAQAMLAHASPLSFTPTFPVIAQDSHFDANYDPALAFISNEDILAYLNTVSLDLEDDDIRMGGSFSVGSTEGCTLSTATPFAVSHRLSDAQITLVLASEKDKWEINAEQSAEKLHDLNPDALHRRLAYLKDKYLNCPATRLPLAPYKVVFGPAAVAEYFSFLTALGLSGSGLMRGSSYNRLEDVGRLRLSPQVTVEEGPGIPGAFALPTDSFGRSRNKTAWYDQGVLTGFLWDQGGADEFNQQATGHDLPSESFALLPGDRAVYDMQDLSLLAQKEGDLLYVPYLHYTGVVSATKGLITGTSRFGALLYKQDGSIQVPYNVRFTEKLTDIFGSKLVWLSDRQTAYNISNTYEARCPKALVVPQLMCCDGVRVEISNQSY